MRLTPLLLPLLALALAAAILLYGYRPSVTDALLAGLLYAAWKLFRRGHR